MVAKSGGKMNDGRLKEADHYSNREIKVKKRE